MNKIVEEFFAEMDGFLRKLYPDIQIDENPEYAYLSSSNVIRTYRKHYFYSGEYSFAVVERAELDEDGTLMRLNIFVVKKLREEEEEKPQESIQVRLLKLLLYPKTVEELVQHTGMDRQEIQTLIGQYIDAKLVEKRKNKYVLTDKGREALHNIRDFEKIKEFLKEFEKTFEKFF